MTGTGAGPPMTGTGTGEAGGRGKRIRKESFIARQVSFTEFLIQFHLDVHCRLGTTQMMTTTYRHHIEVALSRSVFEVSFADF